MVELTVVVLGSFHGGLHSKPEEGEQRWWIVRLHGEQGTVVVRRWSKYVMRRGVCGFHIGGGAMFVAAS